MTLAGLVHEATRPSNKGMKQTKPAQAMELRSLSPVLGGPEVGVSADDHTTYRGALDTLVGKPLVLSVAANSLKLMRSRSEPQVGFIWVDPPWTLLQNQRIVALADGHPDPGDPDYESKFKAFATQAGLLDGTCLRYAEQLADGSTRFVFDSDVVLVVQAGGASDERNWYDDWYAK
jgi:hypothetical protein